MALSKATLDAITAAVAAALAAQAAPASAPAEAHVRTFATKAQREAGDGFACTAEPKCSRQLRTAKRAAVHGIAAGGHEPR
jgi:hypothetical protein